ncbi:MAG: single-stranded DNA-binding protein [Anaerolineae bacterium]|nr:single-stranded DNA-binding protein [Anaerolineae bacterium]
MGTMINISVTGFVGSESQVREVGEQRVASFSVAVNRKNSNGQKQTLWVRVNCWNKLADVVTEYVHKGSLVQVTTKWLRPSAWVDQNTFNHPNRLRLLDKFRLVAQVRYRNCLWNENRSWKDGSFC